MISIFTDGSSRGNPGPGGWAAIIVNSKKEKENIDSITELGGGEKATTNNRMELMAAAKALQEVQGINKKDEQQRESAETKEIAQITIHTDSSYLINGITKWIKGWKRNGWITKTKDDVVNKDIWMMIDEASQGLTIKWQYVGGHVGIIGNERCDHIATAFADGREVKLFAGSISEYDLPDILNVSRDESAAKAKKSSSSRSKAKAYSYISSVGGVIETHGSWADCEKRVKGAKGARYKKALSREEQDAVIAEFESF